MKSDPVRFRNSLENDAPPADLAPLAAALWHAAKCGGAVNDHWHAAHGIAQDDPSQMGSWVHAHLHRIEGDLANAGYWYRQAGKPASRAPLVAEWEEILDEVLADQ
jgi:hypothetical protein